MDPDIAHVIKWMKSGNGRPQWSKVSALSEVTKNGTLCACEMIFCVESG